MSIRNAEKWAGEEKSPKADQLPRKLNFFHRWLICFKRSLLSALQNAGLHFSGNFCLLGRFRFVVDWLREKRNKQKMGALNTVTANLITVHNDNNPTTILDAHIFEWNKIVNQTKDPYKYTVTCCICPWHVYQWDRHVWGIYVPYAYTKGFNICFNVSGSGFTNSKWALH